MPVWAGAVLTVAGGVVVMLRRRPVAVMAGIGLVGAGAGLLSASVRATEQSQLASLAATIPRCEVKGRIVEQLGGLGTMVALERAECTGSALLQRPGNVVLDAPAAHPGAEMTAAGWLVPLGGGPFDTQRRRLGALAAFDADELNIGRVSGFLPTVAARIRGGLRAATATMDEKTAAILRGLSIGDVTDIDPGTEESLRRAGLSHLVAVSGSNVAIVLGSVALACRRFGLQLRVGLAGAVLVIFVAVVGPEPSVLRAAFMGGIGLTAIAAGHRADPLHGLGLVVIALLCLRPGMAYSIGLHLSAAATAGIVLWTGPLRRRLRRVPDFIAAPLAATVAAQVAVAPLLVLGFGEISIAAPAANVLAFPAVPIGTILGLLSGLLGAVSPWLGSISARAAAPAAAWILGVGDWLGNEPWASTALPTWGATLLAAPVVLAAVFSIRRAGAE
jgi:competence protein ComEC